MKPLNGFILVKLIERKQTPGGILLVENNKGVSAAEVLNIGNGMYTNYGSSMSMGIAVGDIVHFNLGNAVESVPNSKEFIIHYSNLYAKNID